ncbi:MAG: Crp/Fnr family transcriptional regulator [Glaciimonas sp.]|nr:Crp/Fnr family transcriptional regulator [Glaciimonas sp.]
MSTIENHLIALLPRKDRLHLISACEPVALKLAEVLSEPGIPCRYIYFPTEGFISLVVQIDGKPSVEVGLVGAEGMLGAHVALNITLNPMYALVQGTGHAWRMSARAFQGELTSSPALQRCLKRYLYVMMAQMATSAGCLHSHLIGSRLARWLLMSHDRAHSDNFYVTHEFLAYMLGVRRVGITTAAGSLQRNGLIEYHRGELTILNRRGLEAAACSCYAADQRVYAAVME